MEIFTDWWENKAYHETTMELLQPWLHPELDVKLETDIPWPRIEPTLQSDEIAQLGGTEDWDWSSVGPWLDLGFWQCYEIVFEINI